MPRTVRVGDTVSYHIADGEQTTAVVTAITTQDNVDLEYYHHAAGKTTQTGVLRATTWPPAADTFHKEA